MDTVHWLGQILIEKMFRILDPLSPSDIRTEGFHSVGADRKIYAQSVENKF